MLLRTKQILFAYLLLQAFNKTSTADTKPNFIGRQLHEMNIKAIRGVLETSTTDESLQRKIESLTHNADGLNAATNPVFINYKTKLKQGLAQPAQDLRSFLQMYLQELEQSTLATHSQR